LHYYAIIIILDVKGLRSTILSFIAIISWTIYRPAKFAIMTGLYVNLCMHSARMLPIKCQSIISQASIYNTGLTTTCQDLFLFLHSTTPEQQCKN